MTMAADLQALSVPSIIPKLCIERATPTGSRFVPLIPADQIPHPIRGIPLRITGRQMTDEAWHLIGEPIPGIPITLSAHLSTSPTPKYRAPDHNVARGEAAQNLSESGRQANCSSSYSTSTVECPGLMLEQHCNKDEDDENLKSPPLPITNSKPLYRSSPSYAAESDSNASRKSLLAIKESNVHAPHQEVDHTDATQSVGPSTPTRIESTRTMSEQQIYMPQSYSLIMENGRGKREIFNDSNSRAVSHRTHASQRSRPDKIYCTHWINTGSCLYGPRCVYLHVMPEIDLLREVTGLKSYPQWWKDEKATKPRGATWLETKIRAEKVNAGDHSDSARIFAPPQMPDPSLWRSSRGQNRIAEESLTKKTIETEDQKSQVVDVGSSVTQVHRDAPAVSAAIAVVPNCAPGYAPLSASSTPPTPPPASIRKTITSPTIIRRLSQLSLSSSSTVSTRSTPDRSKVQSPPTCKKGKRSAAPPSVPQPKKTGLAASIYAPQDNEKDISGGSYEIQSCHNRSNRYARRSRAQVKFPDAANLLINLEKPMVEQYVLASEKHLLSD